MGVVNQPASTIASMQGLLHKGICTRASRQWLDQKPEAGDHVRDELFRRFTSGSRSARYRPPNGRPFARFLMTTIC